MAFGKGRKSPVKDDSVTHVSETQEDDSDIAEVDQETFATSQASGSRNKKKSSEEKDQMKPLIDEVTFKGAGKGKNPGGAKMWMCNHCKADFTSTYTRIHKHFFGVVGKKNDIQRCPAMLKDRTLADRLSKKVKDAEISGVAKCLRNSVLSKNAASSKFIEKSFGLVNRKDMDVKIELALCANGIAHNVLRNPQFIDMLMAIQHAPAGYIPPSSEKARTS